MSQDDTNLDILQWSHFIDVSTITDKMTKMCLAVPDDSIDALCQRLNLHSIDRMEIEYKLQRHAINRYIYIQGHIVAEIKQKCVITTDPVFEHIDDEFVAWFAEPNTTAVSFEKAKRERMSAKERDEQPMLAEEEDPEQIVNGKIDLGELTVQNFSLALEPYPKAEGAVFESASKGLGDEPDGVYNNPFAALKEWKDKESKGE